MRWQYPLSILVMLTCVAGAALNAADPGEGAAEIQKLLDEARAATTRRDADDRLAMAERYLAGQGGLLSALDREFIAADIMQSRGRVELGFLLGPPAPETLRASAERHLIQARDAYARLKGQCEATASQAEQGVDITRPDTVKAYQQAQAYVMKAAYGLAWTEYNLGLVFPPGQADRRAAMRRAVEAFKLLTGSGYRDHPVVSECFLGQALCLYELANYGAASSLLEPIRADNCGIMVYKRVMCLRVQALSARGGFDEAIVAAEAYFSNLDPDARWDHVELRMAVEYLKCLVARKAVPANRSRLDAMKKRLYDYGDPWATETATLLGEKPPPSAARSLATARTLWDAKRYAEIVPEVEKGLGTAPIPAVAADLVFFKVAALWNLERWRDAHLAAFAFLRLYPHDGRLLEVCSRAVLAAIKALDASPRLEQSEFDLFNAYVQQHLPEVPEVQKIAWYRGRQLIAAGRFTEADLVLGTITKGSPAYGHAQYGLAMSAYRQGEKLWAGPQSDSSLAADHLRRGVQAAERFIQLVGTPAETQCAEIIDPMIVVVLAIAERLLELPHPYPANAMALLDRLDAEPILENKGKVHRRVLRLRHLLMHGSDPDRALRLADGILLAQANDPAAAGALDSATDPLETLSASLVARGERQSATEVDTRIVRIYHVLLDDVHRQQTQASGSSKQADDIERITRRETAIRRRLAAVLVRSGQSSLAIAHYEWLAKRVPRAEAADIWRGLALAYEDSQYVDQAVEPWRILSKGLKPDSDGWYEAQYHLIRCHWLAGRQDHARKLAAYFRMQCPNGPPDAWKERMEALFREINAKATESTPYSTGDQ